MVRFIVLYCANVTSSIDLVVKDYQDGVLLDIVYVYIRKAQLLSTNFQEELVLPPHSTLHREKNKAGTVQPGVQSNLLNR